MQLILNIRGYEITVLGQKKEPGPSIYILDSEGNINVDTLREILSFNRRVPYEKN